MSAFIKICGLTRARDIAAATHAGASHYGLVFDVRSRRAISHDAAAALRALAPSTLKSVALIVDAPDAEIATIIRIVRPDLLQLHGQESPQRTAHIRACFGLPVIKAIGIAGPADLTVARSYQACADLILLDAKVALGTEAMAPGGRGQTFDWTLLRDHQFSKPWILAGGLRPSTVEAAIAATRADGVDVSSGVESEPGVKDCDRIIEFCQAAHRAFAKDIAV